MKRKMQHRKDFLEIFQKLCYVRSAWEVWNDFLFCSAVSIANVFPTKERENREKEYQDRLYRYRKEEMGKLAELLGCVVMSLEQNPEQDFLGELYHELRLEQVQKGQFFTPYNISRMMAEIQFADGTAEAEIRRKGYINVSDPACGAGAMLIAFANAARSRKINYQSQVLFVAQDIDRTAVLMCYVQLSLLGCPAVVIQGDSLVKPGLQEENEIWYTPFYQLNQWRFRDVRQRIDTGQRIFSQEPDGQMVLHWDDAA